MRTISRWLAHIGGEHRMAPPASPGRWLSEAELDQVAAAGGSKNGGLGSGGGSGVMSPPRLD
jgi:hypothetical protein